MKEYEAAINIFLQKLKTDKNIIGAIVTGSYIHGQVDKHSDIDIYVILHPDCDYRERGNTWINQIEVEYFKNPPQQVRSYFKTEKSPHTAHMLAWGEIRLDRDPAVTELVAEATQILQERPPALKNVQIELSKYGLDDLSKDLMDTSLKDDLIGFQLIRMEIINLCIDILIQKHRERRYKHKGLSAQIQQIDTHFFSLLQALFREPDKVEALYKLIAYTEELLGGKRTNEWNLRSPLDLA